MSAQQSSPYVQITESFLDIGYYLASVQADPKLYETVLAADLLILPTDLSSEDAGYAYPAGTPLLFEAFQQQLAGRGIVEATIRDEDYCEFAYYSDDIIIPIMFIAKEALLPIAVDVIATLIRDKFNNRSDPQLKSEIHYRNRDGSQWELKYDGPASAFERVVSNLLAQRDSPPEKNERNDDE